MPLTVFVAGDGTYPTPASYNLDYVTPATCRVIVACEALEP